MSRHRPTRTHLLLGLVVVLLATIPVLVPLVVFRGDEPRPGDVQLASGPGEGTMPEAAPVPAPGASGPTTPPPAAAGSLAPTTDRPATPSPTAAATTPAPPAATDADSSAPAAADPTTDGPASASPSAEAQVLDAAANLVVVGVSWTPEPSDAGQPVVFSAVVRNTGAAATPALPTGVAFSVDGGVVSWSDGDSTPLGPGEQRTFTADDGVTGAAWTATDGDHAVAATVDDTGQIPEINEDDNTATAQLDVP